MKKQSFAQVYHIDQYEWIRILNDLLYRLSKEESRKWTIVAIENYIDVLYSFISFNYSDPTDNANISIYNGYFNTGLFSKDQLPIIAICDNKELKFKGFYTLPEIEKEYSKEKYEKICSDHLVTYQPLHLWNENMEKLHEDLSPHFKDCCFLRGFISMQRVKYESKSRLSLFLGEIFTKTWTENERNFYYLAFLAEKDSYKIKKIIPMTLMIFIKL